MRLAAHLALAAVGLLAVLWSATWAADPVIMCRDVVMGPGTVCANAEGTHTQTYEERLATWQAARPVVAVAGVAVAGFGLVLARQDARRAGVRDQGSRLIGP